MGAHPDRAAARVHALLEAIERDRLARALPHGFTDREVRRRIVAPPSLARAAPRTAALVRRIEAGGFRVHLFDLSAAGGLDGDLDLGLPCAAAALVDLGSGPVPVTAGYACRLRRDDALRAAVLEAAQSRLTEIHGAREDVVHGGREEGIGLARLCARARPTRPAAALPDLPSSAPPRTALANLARRLGRAGFSRAAACDLAAPPGIHAVKMVVPGLLLSELL
jgi:ribosomal protein S12 methylthiotransferase accessory factor